jgi:hypothetical protein
MTVIVEGNLIANGQKRTEVIHQNALVVLEVHVGPGYPAEARLQFKADHTRAEAVALAARRGATVRVESEGFFPRTDHSTAAIVLTNITAASIDGAPVYP